MPTDKELFESKMNALANSINTKAGLTGAKDLDDLKDAVDGITVGVDTSDATATANDILSGKSAYGSAGTKLDGTIPKQEAQTITPTTVDQMIPAGKFLNGSQIIKGDANLIPANIADGVTIFGVLGTHQGGGYTKPSYLISDGDTISTFYFNKDYAIKTFLASLTYSEDPSTGLYVCMLGFSSPSTLNNFFAVELSAAGLQNEYALVWNDGTTVTPIYISVAVPTFGVTTAGWQVGSFTPDSSVTVDEDYINVSFLAIMDSVVAKDDIAFGDHGGGKAHTFQIPTIADTYTYTGSSQTPTIAGFYADFMTKSGNIIETNVGNYSITVSLADTTNCQWSDGTITDKTVSWSIVKAALPKPTLSTAAIQLDDSTTTGTFIVSRLGNGAITATSSNPSKISASVSGPIVTVTALDTSAEATANITITVAEGTNYLAYTDTDVACLVNLVVTLKNSLYINTTASNVKLKLQVSELLEGDRITIEYGDGTSFTAQKLYGSAINFPTHTYVDPGNYIAIFKPSRNWSPGTGSVSSNIIARGAGNTPPIPTGCTIPKFIGASNIINLKNYAFENIPTLEEIILPDELETIGDYAFNKDTGLQSLTIPQNVTSIGSWAFYNCSSLRTLIVKAVNPPTIQTNTFRNVPADCAIYVPAASVADYQSAQYWSNRAQYIQAIPT